MKPGAIVTDAGRGPGKPAAAQPSRRPLFLEAARRLRAAQSDEEAADVLEALAELSRPE